MDPVFNLDAPLLSPTLIAARKGVSVEAVESAAKRLGVQYTRNAANRRLLSLRDAQKISKHFDRR